MNFTVWAIDPGSDMGHRSYTGQGEDLRRTADTVTIITKRDEHGEPAERVLIPWSSVIRIEETVGESGEPLIASM